MTGRSPFDRNDGFQSIRDEDPDFAIPKKTRKRCVCCCIPLWGCLFLLLVFVGGVGIATFFLWPRMPQVTFVNAAMPDKGSAQITQDSASVQFPVNLQFNNPNYIPINVQNLDMDLYLRPGNSADLKVGNGWINSPMRFPPKSLTNFTIQTRIIANLTDRSDKNVQGLTYLLKQCSSNQKIKVDYTAKADVPSIAFLGLRPQFSGSIDIDCPFDTSQIMSKMNPTNPTNPSNPTQH